MNTDDLYQIAELRPFIPAIIELQNRIDGIEKYRKPLGFELAESYETEEQLFHDLFRQKAFAFQVSNERAECWDILIETFGQFASRSADLTFAAKGNSPERLQAISKWLIQLCDWAGTGYSNTTRH
jgi:glucose-6-phosphate 1-dehydrogenase